MEHTPLAVVQKTVWIAERHLGEWMQSEPYFISHAASPVSTVAGSCAVLIRTISRALPLWHMHLCGRKRLALTTDPFHHRSWRLSCSQQKRSISNASSVAVLFGVFIFLWDWWCCAVLYPFAFRTQYSVVKCRCETNWIVDWCGSPP